MDSSLEEIIFSNEAKKIKDIHKNGNVMTSNLICKNCDQLRNRNDALIYSNAKNMQPGKSSMQIHI
jgi:hypothetical protein